MGVEVEQVRFDREGIGAEGGAVADVGDGLEEFVFHLERGDVNAVGRQKFGVGREVDGGDGVACAVATAARGRGLHGEGTAKQGAGLRDLGVADELADAAAERWPRRAGRTARMRGR